MQVRDMPKWLWHSIRWLSALCLLWGCGWNSPSIPRTQTVVRSGLLPPLTFRESDVLGQWENTFTQYHRETLVLTEDRRFTQIFETFQPVRREVGTGTWYLEQRASGCVYLHLEGMRFFYGSETFERYGNRWSPQGDPYPFWDRCEARTIYIPDKVILIVTDRPNGPRGIGLLFPATSNVPTSAEEMTLITDANGTPLPTSTPLVQP